MYSYRTGLGQIWVGAKLPPDPSSNIIWLRPSDDHKVLWEIRTYNIYKESWEVLTSAALTADGLLILIRDLEKRCKSLEELKVVLYDTIQNLTPEEQKIARQNIGAISLEDLPPQVEIVQEVGSSTTAVMSQNAVTEELLQKVGVDAIVDTTGNSSNLVMSQASVTEELRKKASVESVTDGISAHNTSSTSHADIRKLLNTCVGLPAYDSSSYKITFTTLAGTSVEIDLPIEQLALRYNAETESIEFDNADGTTTSIPVSAFVKEYVGSIGDRIQISIDENNAIHATVLKNSIDWDCLSVELQERIKDHVTSVDFATKAVRTDIEQTLSIEAQNQALENIGADLMVIDLVNGQAVLTEEQEARLLSCKGVILRGTVNAGKEVLTKIYFSDYQGEDQVSFWAVRNNRYILQCIYTKSTKLFRFLGSSSFIDPNAVSIKAQTLNATQQEQAFANLGWKVHVISKSVIGSSDAVSDGEKATRLSATALLVQETGLLYNFSISSGGSRHFYGQFSNSFCTALNVNEATGVITSNFVYLYDPSAVSFGRNQSSVSDDNKNKALGNIGIDLVRIPYSLLGTTLSDKMFAVVDNARGIILVDTPSNYENPTVFIKGFNGSLACAFLGFVKETTCCIFTLNKPNKFLSVISSSFTYKGSVRYAEAQSLTDTQKQQARSNIDAVGSSGIKGVEIVYSTAPMQQDNILYIELEETT